MRVRDVTKGPLYPDDGPRGARLIRRFRGIGLEVLAFIVVTVLLVPALVVALIVDGVLFLVRRKVPTAARLTLMLWWFLFGEMRALVVLVWIWTTSGGPFGVGSTRRTLGIYNLRRRWARSHMGGVRLLFGLRFDVENLELAAPGPAVMMMRHASIIDNALPDYLVTQHHGIGLRFVIKRELQVIPTIDIGGRWCPTFYTRRGAGDTVAELAGLRRLPDRLGPGEELLIYPEGTRFTEAKLARAQEVIAERQPRLAERAARFRNLLPPRLGGPLALMDASPESDVVICGHTGFDGFAHLSNIWRGKLVGSTIHVRFWRYPASEIPRDDDGRADWLYERWLELDTWVASKRGRPAPDTPKVAAGSAASWRLRSEKP